MPFGLKGAPAPFQIPVDCILKSLPYTKSILDDITVFSNPFNAHTAHMRHVLIRLRVVRLTLKVEEYKLLQSQTEYLRHKIENGIITPLREKRGKKN